MLSRILQRLYKLRYIIQDHTPLADELYPIVLEHGNYITQQMGEEITWNNVTPVINHDHTATLTSKGNIVGYVSTLESIGKL